MPVPKPSPKICPTTEENYTKASSLANAQLGELVSFGRYEQDNLPETIDEEILWIVVEKNDSGMKLMSLYCLDVVPFMSNADPAQVGKFLCPPVPQR